MKKIAILGATGHIGKALASALKDHKEYEVLLFARSLPKLRAFISEIEAEGAILGQPIEEFGREDYDIIVNGIGFGTPKSIQSAGSNIFNVTESFDHLILGYIGEHKETLYVNLSSGAVYGQVFSNPIGADTPSTFDLNNLGFDDYYSIAKINSEAKHRSLTDLNIVDLRIFSFFSRFIDQNAGFLLSEIINCVNEGRTLVTSSEDIKRDYVSTEDLLELIILCGERKPINDSFDVYSRSPVTKFDILDYFKKNYGLTYVIVETKKPVGVAVGKSAYYSTNKKAAGLGYFPRDCSMDCIRKVANEIL